MSRVKELIAASEKLLSSENRIIRDRILEAFDFESVAKVMASVNWTYHDGPPDAESLRETAVLLLNDVLTDDSRAERCTHSGGFEASKDDGEVSLIFVLQARTYDRRTDEIVQI